MTAEDCARLNELHAARWETEAQRWAAANDADDRRFGRRCKAIADELRYVAGLVRRQMDRAA